MAWERSLLLCPHKTGTQCKCWPCLLADHPAGCLNEISLQGMSSMGAECDLPGFFSWGKEESVLCLLFAWVQAIRLLIWWWWCIFRSAHKEVTRCSFYSTLPCCQDPQFWDLSWCLRSCSMRQLCSYLPLTRKCKKGIYRFNCNAGSCSALLVKPVRVKLLGRTEAHL